MLLQSSSLNFPQLGCQELAVCLGVFKKGGNLPRKPAKCWEALKLSFLLGHKAAWAEPSRWFFNCKSRKSGKKRFLGGDLCPSGAVPPFAVTLVLKNKTLSQNKCKMKITDYIGNTERRQVQEIAHCGEDLWYCRSGKCWRPVSGHQWDRCWFLWGIPTLLRSDSIPSLSACKSKLWFFQTPRGERHKRDNALCFRVQ